MELRSLKLLSLLRLLAFLQARRVMMIGHLHYANTQKVVRTLDSSLDALQVRTMSKAGSSYLYIYKLDNGYYTRVLSDNLGSFDDTKLTSDGTKLCNNTIKIRKDSSTGEELTEPGAGGTFIKIAYKKTAFYDDCTNVNAIYIDGVPAYTIRLVKDTGRHFTEQ